MELLEYLSGKIGCMFVPDLCGIPGNRFFITKLNSRMEPDDFPLADWQDAAEYLFGSAPRFTPAQKAQDFFLRQGGLGRCP